MSEKLMRYEVTWYNYVSQETEIIHILAKSVEEARETAVYVMKRFGGERYDESDIESVIDVEDDDYITLEEAKTNYEKARKDFEERMKNRT